MRPDQLRSTLRTPASAVSRRRQVVPDRLEPLTPLAVFPNNPLSGHKQTLQPQEAPPRPSSAVQRLMAATAGLMGEDNESALGREQPTQPGATEAPPRPLSRQDALARIGELQRTRP
jgi:hypothetical protein